MGANLRRKIRWEVYGKMGGLGQFYKTYLTEQQVKTRIEELMKTDLFIRFAVGTYTGDAAASKAITGVGFQPKVVVVWEKVTNKAFIVKSNQDTTKAFVITHAAGTLYVDDIIISLDADGFTVGDGSGSANYANEAQAYSYIAFG